MHIVKSFFKLLFHLIIPCFIGFICLEVASFFLVKNQLLPINESPINYGDYQTVASWRSEQESWGAWHAKEAKAIHETPCFFASYSSNEVGARDSSFSDELNKSKYILLGDSFAEGYGVSDDLNVQHRLQKMTGKRVFNFGSAGDLGPLQYWLIYEELAKKYTHDGLIIFFLPSNDFADNDYDFWVKTKRTYIDGGGERYRPYYRKAADGYDYFYPKDAIKRENLVGKGLQFTFEGFLKDNFWSYNIIRTIKLINSQKRLKEARSRSDSKYIEEYSGYFDATDDQQKAAVFFLDRIMSQTQAKNIILVAIPSKQDFERIQRGERPQKMFWWQQLASANQRLKKPVKFLDLADHPPENIADVYFSCDGHWNAAGNKWAAEIIEGAFK